jgi:putative endonuclease
MNGTLYIGVTGDIIKRVYQHKKHMLKGFTYNYDVTKLVYFEVFENIESAFTREKQLKKWNRKWKIELIERENPEWRDLYQEITK